MPPFSLLLLSIILFTEQFDLLGWSQTIDIQYNVLGSPLQTCSTKPLTGFYRTGNCTTSVNDAGVHVICAQMTREFLQFSQSVGNDLVTPSTQFPGLNPGDFWCVCAGRWNQAYKAGIIAPVYLAGTHQKALQFVTMKELETGGQELCRNNITNNNICTAY